MDFFAKQYYNATQIVLTALDKVLADKKPVTGENMRDALLRDPQVPGPDPDGVQDQHRQPCRSDINMMSDGKDEQIKSMTAE